jgi:hypothetical protein
VWLKSDTSPPQGDGYFRQLVLDDVEHTFVVRYTARSQLYNPGLVTWGGRLWMVARHEGRNATGGWTTCPKTSLTEGGIVPCPVNTFRMLSFVVLVGLTPSLEPDGSPLRCVPYDFHWPEVASKRQERQLGPEDPRPFEWGSDVYVAVNGPPIARHINPHCVRCMKIQKIFPDFGQAVDLDVAGNHGNQTPPETRCMCFCLQTGTCRSTPARLARVFRPSCVDDSALSHNQTESSHSFLVEYFHICQSSSSTTNSTAGR